jgi:hypothetical protein
MSVDVREEGREVAVSAVVLKCPGFRTMSGVVVEDKQGAWRVDVA